MTAWRIAVAVGVALIGAHAVVAVPMVRHLSMLVIAYGAAAAALRGPRRLHGGRRRDPAWLVVAAGMVLHALVVTWVSVSTFDPARGTGWWEAVAIAASLAAPLVLLVGSWRVVRAMSPHRDWEGVIDSAVIGVALSAMLWRLTASPLAGLELPAPLLPVMMLTALSPIATVAVVARMIFQHPRVPAAWLLLASNVAVGVGNALSVRSGADELGSAAFVAWCVAFVAAGAALSHPSVVALGGAHEGERPPEQASHGRLGVLGGALIVAQVAAAWQQDAAASVVPVAAAVAATGLVLWRLSRLLSEREEARRELGRRATEQAAVAHLGALATADVSARQLLDEALSVVTRVLPDVEATIDVGEVSGSDDSDVDPGTVAVVVPVGEGAHARRLAVTGPHRRLDDAERRFLRAVGLVLTGGLRWRLLHDAAVQRSLHDTLTGLPNRALLLERLDRALAEADHHVGVLFVDLDRFKAVNDELGHDAGDELLRQVAARVQSVLRSGDTVARLAGDEFVVVCPQLDDPDDAHHTAQRIADAVSRPVVLPTGEIRIAASVGVAWSTPGTTVHAEQLLRSADQAMYAVKRLRTADRGATELAPRPSLV